MGGNTEKRRWRREGIEKRKHPLSFGLIKRNVIKRNVCPIYLGWSIREHIKTAYYSHHAPVWRGVARYGSMCNNKNRKKMLTSARGALEVRRSVNKTINRFVLRSLLTKDCVDYTKSIICQIKSNKKPSSYTIVFILPIIG